MSFSSVSLFCSLLFISSDSVFAWPPPPGRCTVSPQGAASPLSSSAEPPSFPPSTSSNPSNATALSASSPCFPSLDFKMPSNVPNSLDNWWCPMNTEYAFMGFSYEVTPCQSPSQLNAEFADIRNNFNGRYVRLYGACDNPGFYDDIVEAAWNNGLGVHALIWFGFTGGNEWEARRDSLINTLTTNPKAKFVTRGVQFGSEPLFDNVLPHPKLAMQVILARLRLTGVHIPVTISELAYGYQERDGAQDVLDAIDYISVHVLPFFSSLASTGAQAWPLVETDMNWFIQRGKGKKIFFSQNGWPSVTSSGVQPNSPNADASVNSEQQYYQMLDSHCTDFKNAPSGVGWFAHIYTDSQEPGYGIYDANSVLKFPFRPRTSC